MEFTLIDIGAAAGAIIAVIGVGKWLKGVITAATKPIRELEKKLEAHNNTARATLRYSITRAYADHKLRNSISAYALECIEDMNTQYKALGGNGYVSTLVAELEALPKEP